MRERLEEGFVPMLLCAEDAAPLIGMSKGKIRDAMDDQRDPIPHVQLGCNRLVNMAHVQEWLDGRTIGLPATSR